jgi:hypothetical protein
MTRAKRTFRHRRSGRPVAQAVVTSFHEAGHIVLALEHGLPVSLATLEGQDGEGYIEHGPSLNWLSDALRTTEAIALSERQRRQLEADIDVALGGVVAETVLLGGRPSQLWTAKGYSDREDAEAAARLLGRSREYVMSRRAVVRRILVERWPEVAGIAKALRRRKRVWAWLEVRGPELRAIARAARAGGRRS